MTGVKSHMTRRCFEIMLRGLRFNICDFPSSFQRNKDVENLGSIISAKIPLLLSYACRHWPYHASELEDMTDSKPLLVRLLGTQFLYWLEVMSLLECNPNVALMKIYTLVSDRERVFILSESRH